MPEPGWLVDHVPLIRVDTLDKLDECRRWAGERRDTPLFADTESGGLDPHRHRHRLSQLGDMGHGWAFPPAWFGAFNEIVRRHRGLIGFHNSSYDWRVLAVHQGLVPVWDRTEDSNLLCRLGNSADKADLKGQAVKKVDPSADRAQAELKYSMRRNGWTWDTVPDTWEPYWRYAALDPVLTAHLWQLHLPVRAAYPWAYDLERATARICTNMMMAGMLLDEPYVRDRITEISEYVREARAWLAAVHGIANVNSNEQVARAFEAAGIPLTIRTGHDNPSFDKDALKTYRFMYPSDAALIDAITWCRKGESLVGRYLEKFLAMAGPDGVVHYSIHSCQARTTRMSVTDPPMQTFDRDVPFVRGSFRPRPGHVFITIDADQIEARLAAHFSRDPNMIAEFRRCDELGLKFFIEMASKIYGETITKRDPRYTWTKNACVPLYSKILTRRGWLAHDEVRIGDETIGLNLATGHSEWTRVTGVHVYENAPVQSFGNQYRFRLNATPDHKWAVRRDYGRDRADRRLELVPQCDLNKHRDQVVLAAPLEDRGTIKLTEQEAQVLGWLLSDGRITISRQLGGPSQSHGAKRAVSGEIYQSEHKYAAEIDMLLADVPHYRSVIDGMVRWHLRPQWLRRLLTVAGMYQQLVKPEVLACSLDPVSRARIAETMRKADGDPFTKGSRWRIDFYSMLVYLLGETPLIRTREPASSAWQKQDCWVVRRSKPVMTMQRSVFKDGERQPVWCVTTGLGTWTTRQGDAVVITGNTYAQIYGSGLARAAATAGVPTIEMEPAYNGLAALYPNVKRLMNRLIWRAKEGEPAVRIIDGRVLRVDRGHEYALLNTLIQGSAAVIAKKGLIDLDAAGFGPYLRLVVHDEYLIEAPEQYAKDMLAEAERILTDRVNFATPVTWHGDILETRWCKT